MTFSEKLVLLRRRDGFLQEELADQLGVSKQTIQSWEAQQVFPETQFLVRLSDLFNVTLDELLNDSVELASLLKSGSEFPESVSETMVVCSQCGRENNSESKFCGYCGYSFCGCISVHSRDEKLSKDDIDLAYYRANLQMQQEAIRLQKEEIELERHKLEEAKKQSAEQQRIADVQQRLYDKMAKCPRCGSTALSGNKKGYGVGKGLVGAALIGPVGLLAGGLGANKVMTTCLNCGYKFKAGRKF